MKRKAQNIILMILLVAVCLTVFSGCQNTKADYFTYSEANLGAVGKLVKLMHDWIQNYGWTVVVFTVFLKILMLPLDIWQRVSSKKSSLKMQKLQPLMQEIDKRYGANSQRANAEKQKLYKKQGYSAFAMCLPMIVSMIIFFVMFGGLREYSTYSSVKNFQELSDTYFDSYYTAVQNDKDATAEWAYLESEYNSIFNNSTEENPYKKKISAQMVGIRHLENNPAFEGTNFSKFSNEALGKVSEYYSTHHESWLWIQNVWQPDTWVTIMPAYNDRSNGFSSTVDMSEFGVDNGLSHYEMIRGAVLKTGQRGDGGTWNGLMLLPFLSIGLSFLSIFLTQQMERRGKGGKKVAQDAQQAATNRTMMIMMPLMMAFFGFMYTGAFAIYMVFNYILSIISSVAMYYPVEKIVQKSIAKMDIEEKESKASYMR